MSRAATTTSEPATLNGLVLAGDRPAGVVAFDTQVVDFFVEAAALLGVPKSVAAIYGIVFASPAPLSFADIESRLNISKGSISQGLKVLREVGALKEVSTTDERMSRFEPDTELRKLITHFLESRVETQLESGSRRVKALSVALSVYPLYEQKGLKVRVQKLEQWQKRTRAVLPVVKTFLQLGA